MTPDRSKAPETHPFGRLTMPLQTVEKLPNGITFHHLRGGDQPVCTLTVSFEGGIAELREAAARTMLGQLTEQTDKHSPEELSEIIDYNGARLSVQVMSHHSVIKLFALSKRMPDMLPLFREIIMSPNFNAERLEIAKAKAISNLQTARMDTAVLADEALAPLIWGPENPLSHIVTEEDYASLTPSVLKDIHCRMVSAKRCHAFLSGLYSDALLDAVRRMLSEIESFGDGTPVRLVEATPAAPESIVRVPFEGSLQDAISIAIPTIHRSDPDYIPLHLTVMALGGYFGSRLMTNIREEKGLTYGISAALLGELQGSYIYINAKCDRRFTDTVLSEIRNELTRLSTAPPEGEELERLRTYAATNQAKILDTPSSCMQYYQNIIFTGTPADYFEQKLCHIAQLDSNTIARISSKYLLPEALITTVAGSKDD